MNVASQDFVKLNDFMITIDCLLFRGPERGHGSYMRYQEASYLRHAQAVIIPGHETTFGPELRSCPEEIHNLMNLLCEKDVSTEQLNAALARTIDIDRNLNHMSLVEVLRSIQHWINRRIVENYYLK